MRTRKKLELFIFSFIISTILFGCATPTPTIRISHIFSSNDIYEKIYVDGETGVMYLCEHGYLEDTICVMLNTDGTPRVYNADESNYSKVHYIFSSNDIYEKIYVDGETGVMYLCEHGYLEDAICVMLNADGTPKVAN